ncbi:MAG: penicillin-binding protein activator [Guyparkeria sp.]|uniref:penicillin-binding protein activator n=1 Tax=Guyparkeria sp. TaxID=2035736 RepID=UPI00397DE48D
MPTTNRQFPQKDTATDMCLTADHGHPRTIRTVLAAIALLTMAGCAQVAVSPEQTQRSEAQARVDQARADADPVALTSAQMELSRTLTGPERAEQQLTAIETAVDALELELARELYQQTDTREQWPRVDRRRATLAEGIGHWAEGDIDRAIRTIADLPLPLAEETERRRLLLLGALNVDKGNAIKGARFYSALGERLPDEPAEQIHARLWDILANVDTRQLADARERTTDPVFDGWLELALDYRQRPERLSSWASANPEHPATTGGFVEILATTGALGSLEGLRAPDRDGPIAVLLPEDKRYEGISEEIRRGIEYAREATSLGSRRDLFYIDSGTDGLSARVAVEQAIDRGASVIIGPLVKEQVSALNGLPANGPVVIALNSTPDGASLPSGIISYSLSPEQDAIAVANRMLTDGHQRVGVFAADTRLGRRARDAFVDEFTLQGGEILDEATFSDGQTDFSRELTRLLKMRSEEDGPFQPEIRDDMDAIFVAGAGEDLSLAAPQLDYFGADDLPRYGLSSVYSGNRDPRGDKDKNKTIVPISPMLLAGSAGPDHPMRLAYERAQLAGSLPRLFAFGADAAMLAAHLDVLLDGGVVSGLTGDLSLTPIGVIERSTVWGQFRDGQLRPYGTRTGLPSAESPVSPASRPAASPDATPPGSDDTFFRIVE